MANINIGSVSATFRANNQQFMRATRQNIDALRRQQAAFSKSSQQINRVSAVFSRLGDTLRRFRVRALAIVAAIGFVARGLVRATRNASEFGASLIENTRRTGLQVEQLQVLGRAFLSEGASLNTFLRGYKSFQRAIQDGEDGLSTQVRAFRRLGIEIGDFEFSLLSAERQIQLINQGLQGLSETAQSSTLQQLFGRAGFQLAAALTQSPEEFNRLLREQAGIGPVIDAAQSQALKDLEQAFTDLATAIKSRLIRVIAALAPALTAFLDAITAVVGIISDLSQAVLVPVRAITSLVSRLIDFGSGLFGGENEATIEAARDLKEAAQDLKDSASLLRGRQESLDFTIPRLGRTLENTINQINALVKQVLDSEGGRLIFRDGAIDPLDQRTGLEAIREFFQIFNDPERLLRLYVRYPNSVYDAGRNTIRLAEINRLRERLVADAEQIGSELLSALDRFNTNIINSLDTASTELETAVRRTRLQRSLDAAPDAQTRVDIRYRDIIANTEERILQLDLQVSAYQQQINRILEAGILTPEQERQLLDQGAKVVNNAENLRNALSEGANATRDLLNEQEKYNSNLILLNAMTTASQDQANAAVKSILERVIASRDSLVDQLALQEAETLQEQVEARLAPYTREYEKLISAREVELEQLNQLRSDAIANREGEESIVRLQEQIKDVTTAIEQLKAEQPLYESEVRQGILETLELLDKLGEGAEGAAGAVRTLGTSLQGFDFQGLLISGRDFVRSLREQNEEIGLQATELARLRAVREGRNFVESETVRLNQQLADAVTELKRATNSGDETAIANAKIRLDLARALNKEFLASLGIINAEIERTAQAAETEAADGERLRRIQGIAEDAGRAWGRFTGDLIRNFNSIGDAARRLGQTIVDSLIRRLIEQPITNFFTNLLASSLGGIPGLQSGGLGRGLTLVGEAGPELVDFRRPGRVYSNEDLADALSGNTGGTVFNFAPVINSSDPAAVNRALAEAYPIFETRVLSRLQLDARRRSSLRQSIRG